jgi:biopolymer transport protein ExbD
VSRMVFRERRRTKSVDLNVTSLVDVLFLLLIFFMLTTTFKHAGELELNLPESSTAGPRARARVRKVWTWCSPSRAPCSWTAPP